MRGLARRDSLPERARENTYALFQNRENPGNALGAEDPKTAEIAFPASPTFSVTSCLRALHKNPSWSSGEGSRGTPQGPLSVLGDLSLWVASSRPLRGQGPADARGRNRAPRLSPAPVCWAPMPRLAKGSIAGSPFGSALRQGLPRNLPTCPDSLLAPPRYLSRYL